MFGVGVGALALVIVLSGFNGIQDLVEELYSRFDPEIRIEATKGKTFPINAFPLDVISNMEEVKHTNRSLEETVLIKFEDRQAFATIKGVDETFVEMSGLDSLLWAGTSTLVREDGEPFMIMGLLVADKLGAALHNVLSPLSIYAAKRNGSVAMQIENAFYIEPIYPSGIFAINPEFDAKYTVAPYSFVEKLIQKEGEVTAIELSLKDGTNPNLVKEKIKTVLGDSYTVKTRYELNEVLFKTNNSEKWVTFLVMTFILVIATFNIVGSLTILILDKKKDIMVLKTMGATTGLVRKIFFVEGMLISIIGGVSGLLIGLAIVYAQMQFGLVRTEGLLVDYYPVKVDWLDMLYIVLLVLVIGGIAAWLPARFVTKKYNQSLT